jgi:transposase
VADIFVGIDVSKAHLDVSVRPGGERRRFSQDDGLAELAEFVSATGARLVVLEATGGDQRQLLLPGDDNYFCRSMPS